MTTRYLMTPLAALALLAAPLAAQSTADTRTAPLPSGDIAVELSGPTQSFSNEAAAMAPLQLRGGAVATGLHGFYDYQSNGGSPEYIDIRPGSWTNIYTTFMNSLDGSSASTIADSRRVGYAISTDGGATWMSNRSIAEIRLGYPDIEVTQEPLPFIAAHGDVGAGNQIFVYASPTATDINTFFPVGDLPKSTASGRDDRGVIWPSFEISSDGATGYLAASYFSDASNPSSPLQVTSINLGTGQTAPRWSEIPDSIHSTTSGGRYVIARSAGGKLGVAYYHIALFEGDTEYGVYFSESTDNGATWSQPQAVLAGEQIITSLNLNGDEDTLSAGINLDGTYIGEDFTLAMTGSMNSLLRYQNVLYWSKANGLKVVALAHQVPGLGAIGLATALRQGNMGTIAYPTIAASENGQKIVIAFTAVDQREDPNDPTTPISVASEAGFLYYRLWAVGSPDGGQTWGDPFIIQDIYGDGSDSASIEYPAAAPVARMVGDDFELNLVYQAKRLPGQFAFTSANQDPGTPEDVYQYFQRYMVTPQNFVGIPNGVDDLASVSRPTLSRVAPNPASGRANVGFTLERAGDVSLRLVDNLGRVVQTLIADEHRDAGLHSHTLYLDGTARGVYRVVLEQNGQLSSQSIVVR